MTRLILWLVDWLIVLHARLLKTPGTAQSQARAASESCFRSGERIEEKRMTYLADLGKKALGDVGNPGDSEPCMGELQPNEKGW